MSQAAEGGALNSPSHLLSEEEEMAGLGGGEGDETVAKRYVLFLSEQMEETHETESWSLVDSEHSQKTSSFSSCFPADFALVSCTNLAGFCSHPQLLTNRGLFSQNPQGHDLGL